MEKEIKKAISNLEQAIKHLEKADKTFQGADLKHYKKAIQELISCDGGECGLETFVK